MVQCGKHLALFLTVYKRVVVLHRNKRCEIVCNSIIYDFSHQQHTQALRVGYSLCMTWTNPTVSELVARTDTWTRTYIAKRSNCSYQCIGRIPPSQRRVEPAWSPRSAYWDRSGGIVRRRHNQVADAQAISSPNQRYAATRGHKQRMDD